jgi:hypothetical protein
MKLLIAVALLIAGTVATQAGSLNGRSSSYGLYGTGSNSSSSFVQPHFNSNGSMTSGHFRTTPNNTQLDNFSTRGNYNPYTGNIGTRIPRYWTTRLFYVSFCIEQDGGPSGPPSNSLLRGNLFGNQRGLLQGKKMSKCAHARNSHKKLRRKAFELPLNDSHLFAIGHVAARAAMLDSLINLTFHDLISRHPHTIKKELKKFSVPKQIDTIKESLIQNLPTDAKGINNFISEIYSARDERNDIMHRTWRSTDSPEIKALVKITNDAPELEKRRVTAKGMIATADRLLDLALELSDWKMRVYATLVARQPASPDKPRTRVYIPPAPR